MYGFHVTLTHSSARAENMDISEEIRNYISDLIKLLEANQSLEEMFSKLKEEIVSKLEEKIEQQMSQIDKIERKLEKQANRINKLERQTASQRNVPGQLETKCDNNEQYRRGTSTRIHGIEAEVPENESIDNVMAVLKSSQRK